MNCPYCHTTLVNRDRDSSVERCIRCAAIWRYRDDKPDYDHCEAIVERLTNRNLRFSRSDKDSWFQEDHDEKSDYSVFERRQKQTWFEESFLGE